MRVFVTGASGHIGSTEQDTLDGGPRIDSENTAVALAGQGVCAMAMHAIVPGTGANRGRRPGSRCDRRPWLDRRGCYATRG
jgi:hypothetical protein